MAELTCKELVELVTDYFEGQLPEVERQRFEAHLARCVGCQNHLEQMRQTMRLLGKLTEESIAPDTQQELLQIFRNWKSKTST